VVAEIMRHVVSFIAVWMRLKTKPVTTMLSPREAMTSPYCAAVPFRMSVTRKIPRTSFTPADILNAANKMIDETRTGLLSNCLNPRMESRLVIFVRPGRLSFCKVIAKIPTMKNVSALMSSAVEGSNLATRKPPIPDPNTIANDLCVWMNA
jgi:hypothetical protein